MASRKARARKGNAATSAAKPKTSEKEFTANFRSTKEIPIPEKLIDQVVGQENAVKIIRKAAKQRRHVLLIGSPGCLIGDERVFLGNGAIMKIGDFGSRHLEQISKGVMVGKGHSVAEAKVFHAYKNEPVMEIITESGKSIKGTPNHPLLITTKRYAGKRKIRHVKTRKEIEVNWYKPSFEWRRLDEMKIGDRVAVACGVRCTINSYIRTDFASIKRNKFGPKFHGRLPQKVTPPLGALFGYMIGDGWVDSNRERIGFVVADDEKDLLPLLLAFVRENFGIEPYSYARTRQDRKMLMHYVEISNRDIYSNLKFLREKRIPDLILRSGNEVAASFLRWLFTADGTVRNKGRGQRIVSLKSKELELLRDVQTMLLRFGIHSRIDGLNSKSGAAPSLFIGRGNDIIKFNKKIGFACAKKIKIADVLTEEAENFARVNRQRSERVVKIIKGGVADVFDIEVPDGHRFIANGIISHNTGKTMLAQAMAEMLPAAELEDILVYRNINDENTPLVKALKTYPNQQAAEKLGDGQGRITLQRERMKNRTQIGKGGSWITPIVIILVVLLIAASLSGYFSGYEIIVIAALILGIMVFGSVALFTSGLTRRVGALPGMGDVNEPKLIVDNTGLSHAPFMDGTGNKAGALFGDVRHDPLQCIPAGENVVLHNSNPVPIEKIVEPFFNGIGEGEVPVEADLKVMGGVDENFRLAAAKVTKVYKRSYKGPLVRIKTRSGSVIRVTPNHPMAMLDAVGTVYYLEAGNVKPSDKLIIPKMLEASNGQDIQKMLILFMADLLADGWLGQRRIEFNLKNDFKIKQIEEDISNLGFGCHKSVRKSDGATRLSLNSATMSKELVALGIKDSVHAKAKYIPSIVFTQSRASIELFLTRLISLDGYVNKQGQFEILSANRRFIQQVRALLFVLGVNATYKTRKDRGYGKIKGTIQHLLRWNNFEWANVYYKETINPKHKKNLEVYLENTSFGKEAHYDVVPLEFKALEEIRTELDISKEKIHSEYWALTSQVGGNKRLTRAMLAKVVKRFSELKSANPSVEKLSRLASGSYAFDEIVEITKEDYDGFVYNMTTETGNYLVDFILTHNSGGLGTPAHLRVESGAVHRANKGVLFIDEISRLDPKAQQDLLTALQEKRYPITGQSEMSSGAIVKTEPVPCDFVLVAAGNLQDVQNMHPALRSRIRGYGYEVYMDDTISDNATNREKIVQFVAQEVKKDGKIPQFDRAAVEEVLEEARRRSGRKEKLTLVLRDLGGLIRAAGDIAVEKKHDLVTREDVIAAKGLANPIEAQVIEQAVEYRKDYRVFTTKGFNVGKVNGLAVVGGSVLSPGIIMPIVAEVTPASSRSEGKFIPTGKLGKIANEAVKNVSAIIKKHMGRDIANYDMHVQFLQAYEGVEGDSASISVAISIISAMEGIPVDQSVAMTGSLSVRGEVLPVGGITSKVEAAINSGIKSVILPARNIDDVYINEKELKKIKLIPVKTLAEVLQYSLKQSARREQIIKELKKYEHGSQE